LANFNCKEMKSEVNLHIKTDADQTVKAMEKVTCAAKAMKQAIEDLNDTTVVINVESRKGSTKRWYQFWK
jgi:hypothetical protein